MALINIGLAYRAFDGAPDLPQGYHFEQIRKTPNGVRVDVHYRGARIFEIAAESHYSFEYDDPVGTRYAARVVHDNNPRRRAFNQPGTWVEYPDITSLIQAQLARHRIGAQK